MPNRGVFVGFNDDGALRFNDDGTVKGRLPKCEVNLKVERCHYFVAEKYQGQVEPELLAVLAKAAIIGTIDVADPADPDTIWGFVTSDSFKPDSVERDLNL